MIFLENFAVIMSLCRCVYIRNTLRLGFAVTLEENCVRNLHVDLITNKSFTRKFRFDAINRVENNPSTVTDFTQTPSAHNNIEDVKQKLLFNSVLEKENMKFGRVRRAIEAEREKRQKYERLCNRSSNDVPISLKYLPGYQELVATTTSGEDETSDEDERDEHLVQLPFTISVDANQSKDLSRQVAENAKQDLGAAVCGGRRPDNWMKDYEYYDDAVDERDDEDRPWQMNYGTTDPSYPVTKIPCGGCGARLHCRDTAIPGYLPSEILKGRSKAELKSLICQRCHFLQHYNTALAVSVSPDEYPRILSQIKERRALVLLLVDLMDVPCSIWPNILDIIGTKRPVVVVGNKADLLPQDSRGFLLNVERALVECVERSGLSRANIKHVALISAKTGFGVDRLITKLHNEWEYKGDVYLVGCTNTGKSTLFNALLQSDYCKVQAVDLIQRATTSLWPGTTLNLLKFPILRPSAWRLFARTKRLISERQVAAQGATLMGHVGRTFAPEVPVPDGADPFGVGGRAEVARVGIDEYAQAYRESRWCYDTPGVVHRDQLINLLTTEELMLTLPRRLLTPRSFSMGAGSTLFVAGLARLDLVHASKPIRLTVFASEALPLTVCDTSDADLVYSRLIGSELMAVPMGGADRLKQWPGLAQSTGGGLRLVGRDWRRSCGDIVLSSAGWVAVTPGPEMAVELAAWTPGGRGVHLRPPLLPLSVNHRGARVRRCPAYKPGHGRLMPQHH